MATKISTIIEKAEVTIPAPGMRISALRKNPSGNLDMESAERREFAAVHYDMYRTHPWIRASIDKIAKTAGSPALEFTSSDPEQPIKKLHQKTLVKFFRQSHGKKLLRMTYKDLLIYGEAFWWVDVTRGGTPTQAKRLHPMYMDGVVQDDDLIAWRYGPFHQDADAIIYNPEIILHFAMEDPNSDLIGMSPLMSLQETVAQDLFAMRYNRSYFENNAQTGTIFNMKNATKDEVDRNRTWLEENYVGTKNAHRPLILEGDIDVKQSVSKQTDMQFIEGRKLSREEIFGVLDVPPDKLGLNENSNRSVAKEADNTFRQETIAPLQALVEEEVNDRLILELFGWDDILFQHEDSDPRSKLAAMNIFDQALRSGLFSRNEIRADLGRGSIKGGEVFTISTAQGVVALERLLEEPNLATGVVAPPQTAAPKPAAAASGVSPTKKVPNAGS